MRNRFHYRLLAVACVVCLAAASAARAASLQFIVFCDTLDPAIGSNDDLRHTTAWAQAIASYTGLTLHLQSLSSHELTPAKARGVLAAIDSAGDDVICFIYSGHGYNPGDSPWPLFDMMSETRDAPLTFDEVLATLQPKPHRMLIVLSDCCNVPLDGPARSVPRLRSTAPTSLTVPNFQRLFLEFQGTILATASRAGQYSIGGSPEGGLFLSTLMDDLDSLAGRTPTLTWDTVLSTTASDVTEQAAADIATGELGDIEPQQPYYRIEAGQATPANPGVPVSPGTTAPDSPDDDTSPLPSTARCGAAGAIPLLTMVVGCLSLMAVRRTYISRR